MNVIDKEKVNTIEENIPKVYHSGRFNVIKDSSYLKGSESGEHIYLDDVSDIEHTVGVKVSSKNLIPFPYDVTSGESKGLTWTVNDDGGITLNGTRSTIIMINLWFNNINLEDGVKYRLSLANAVDGINIFAYYKDADNGQHWLSSSFTYHKEWTDFRVYLQTKENAVFDNVTVYPMLERGTEATAYTPYVADVTTVKVIANDTEYTPNTDGTVEGIVSISPSMNIITDTEGVVIDCNYYKNIDLAYSKLQQTLALSGGE